MSVVYRDFFGMFRCGREWFEREMLLDATDAILDIDKPAVKMIHRSFQVFG